jgi:hypothetical protein
VDQYANSDSFIHGSKANDPYLCFLFRHGMMPV